MDMFYPAHAGIIELLRDSCIHRNCKMEFLKESIMELSKLLEERRAYRALAPVEITESLINEIADTLKLSPSCFNNQPWRYLFIYEKDILNKTFEALTEGNKWAKKSSMIIAVLSQRDFDCKMPDGRDYYKFDTGMASAILILKATELGLVAHPIAGYSPDKIKEIFNIPAGIEVLTLIIVGKKTSELGSDLNDHQKEVELKRPDRKSNKEFVFLNKFSI
jgi:nitroreductase